MTIHVYFLLFMITMLTVGLGHAQETTPRDDLDYRAIRRQATGREHDQIKTPRGTIFYKVKITRIDDYRVTIEHQDGQSILDYDSIPPEWIKEFNVVARAQSNTRASRTGQPATPEFDMSGIVSIGSESAGGAGILVKSGEAYYVYTDCATISSNAQLSMQLTGGKVLEYAQIIECAEGFPLARIQVKAPGDDVHPVVLASADAGSQLQAHQFLFPLKASDNLRPATIKAVESNTIELSYRISDSERGTAMMTGDKVAVGLFLGKMPDDQRLASYDSRRFESRDLDLVRLDIAYQWKKVRLLDFLSARKRITDFDQKTLLCKAFGECRLSGGKVVIPGNALALFKSQTKNRHVEDLLKLSESLEKKSMRVNEKEVTRKLDNIIDSALRSSKKQMAKVSLDDFSWYHRHFFKESLDWRKGVVTRVEQ
ncbi:MAG: hypothetical protein H7A51_05030 [Akkermansiaceae bacterium]|nr:hypothetical protein [Akkermansiaceae bacterium]